MIGERRSDEVTDSQPTSHEACVEFLKWLLPLHGLHWRGYRKVHRLVCKRLARRLAELGLTGLRNTEHGLQHILMSWLISKQCSAYQYLGSTVTAMYSRQSLRRTSHARRERNAHGRRQHSLLERGLRIGRGALYPAARLAFPARERLASVELEIIATDADDVMISRARVACYGASSLEDLPQAWITQAFQRQTVCFA